MIIKICLINEMFTWSVHLWIFWIIWNVICFKCKFRNINLNIDVLDFAILWLAWFSFQTYMYNWNCTLIITNICHKYGCILFFHHLKELRFCLLTQYKWFVQKFHFIVCVYDNNWFCKFVFNCKKTHSFSHHVLSSKVGFFVTTMFILCSHI
jgi:hypothetical protein